MDITNAREYALEIAATGDVVEPGASVTVDDELGAALLEQPDNWQPAKTKPKTKTEEK